MLRNLCLLFCLVGALPLSAADELTVLPDQLAGGPPKQMLRRYLAQQTQKAFGDRWARFGELKTAEDVAAYQEKLRKLLLQQLGEFPEKTPLNPKIVGELKGERYRAEKLIYESQPNHFVTAIIFLPLTKGPYPAVLVPAGHSQDGKLSNQRVCMLLAQNGIAAMAYDPIGQGERVQIFDDQQRQRFKMTDEHTLLGSTSMLVGRGAATYCIWDGMRSLDYLASREDIDAKRLGVTGCSGGGTLTSYLMALDERVACAAPSCYITSFPRLLATIGPQDAEQNIFGQIALGIDHADYLVLRAPRSTIILAAVQDFFDINGTRDSYRESKRIYEILGQPDRVDKWETNTKHGFPREQREPMVGWMSRWLLKTDGTITAEIDYPTHDAAAGRCSPEGQVMRMPGARSITDLNVALAEKLRPERERLWRKENLPEALAAVRKTAGIRPLSELPAPAIRQAGSIAREGYTIEKLVLEPEPELLLPALLYRPARFTGQKVLYLTDEGKHTAATIGRTLEKLVRAGNLVLAVDVRGCGETGPPAEGKWGGDWNDIYVSYLLGKSMLGMRTEDVLVAGRYLNELKPAAEKPGVRLIGVGAMGPPALHAAAVERDLFNGLELQSSLASWSEYVRHPETKGQMVNSVHGALRVYDLPDLMESLPYQAVVREAVLVSAPK